MTTKTNGPAPAEPEGIVRLSLGADVQQPTDQGGRYVDVIASTADLDREGEILVQDWDLTDYQRNPVVLWNHLSSTGLIDSYSPEDTLPIGFAENVRIEDGVLKARLNFVDENANPLAPKVFEGFRQGSIRAVSVGFTPGQARVEEINGQEVLVLSGNRLLEISATPLPANPFAVVEATAKSISALRARAKEHITMSVKKKAAPGEQSETEAKPTNDQAPAQGQDKAAEPMACEGCKAVNAAGSKFCSMCGKAFPPPQEEPDGDEGKPGPGDGDGDEGKAKSALLQMTGKKTLAEATATVAGWQRASELYSDAASRLATIEAEQREGEVARILEEGSKSGKVAPAQRKAYLSICGADDNGKGADPKRLKALVDALPVVVQMGGAGAPSPAPEGADALLTPEQKAVNKRLGISDEEFLKSIERRKTRASKGK